jgi:hypothetical protein
MSAVVLAPYSAPVKQSIGQPLITHYPWIGQHSPFFAEDEQEMGDEKGKGTVEFACDLPVFELCKKCPNFHKRCVVSE